MPHPHWIRTENVSIPAESITKAAELLTAELGQNGINAVGGKTWWLWRRKGADLKAEWIEMRSDYNTRERQNKKSRRIMLYVHGGAYFFGSVDEHRYQMQRHARKLQARVFAPRYRLAPQFPFPCGLLDCLAAYLYLLTIHEPSEIILAGDSAGGGMVLSLLCLLRDQGMSLPAGAVLISPWVDLTHSFPSLSREDGLDYIPAHGFMQKPSRSWPPPNEDELRELIKARESAVPRPGSDTLTPKAPEYMNTIEVASHARRVQPPLSLQLDGKEVFVKDQIQLYTTNQLITHPLVSPALQPSLGGLPPLLIMVGGGELLRDEQIFVAHKAAEPQRYKLCEHWRRLYDPDDTMVNKYQPTPVQLQVWDDLCHVAPTLSFTRPAKFMYRSIAQFGAWALSRAQKCAIQIEEEDDSSTESSSEDDIGNEKAAHKLANGKPTPNGLHGKIGKAGDPLPHFKNNMIRQQVDRHGDVYPLAKAGDLPCMQMSPDLIGVVKEGPIRQWLAAKQDWDHRYASKRRKIHKLRLEIVKIGKARSAVEGEQPPPSALAARLEDAESYNRTQRLKKSYGLGMWSSWGWKHDEHRIQKGEDYNKKEDKQERKDEKAKVDPNQSDPAIAIQAVDGADTGPPPTSLGPHKSRSRSHGSARAASSRRRTVTVTDQGQIEGESTTTIPQIPKAVNADPGQQTPIQSQLLTDQIETTSPDHLSPTSLFLPKWKQSSHLRDDLPSPSVDTDARSTYSHMVSDNASTRAVFSASGVQQPTAVISSHGSPSVNGNRPTTPLNAHINGEDNLGGYDTPQSQRSVERLRSHQVDFDLVDGQSVHSSLIPASTTGGGESGRPNALRSPSTMAVVGGEGVIDPLTSDGGDGRVLSAMPSDAGKIEERPAAAKKVDMARPGLYNRDNSNFVTAREKL